MLPNANILEVLLWSHDVLRMRGCVRKRKEGHLHLEDALSWQPGSAIHPSLLADRAPATGLPFFELCVCDCWHEEVSRLMCS
jgi:hypothetical protein